MVGEISNSEMRGKNVTKGMFLHSFGRSEKEEEREQSIVEEKVAESDQQIRRCRDRRKLGKVCSVPADARVSPIFL